MKSLFLIRGIPGSGKSTVAKAIHSDLHIEADDYFYDLFGEYRFDPSKIKLAHTWCQTQVSLAMQRDKNTIVVSNTFTQEWEMKPYFEMANEYGYIIHTIIVENRHGNSSIHNVPEETLTKMKNRFEVVL